jgi:hypothetical protein
LARTKQWKKDMELRETAIDGANWIRLDQDRVQCRAFVITVTNLRVPQTKQAVFRNILHHGGSKSVSNYVPFVLFDES